MAEPKRPPPAGRPIGPDSPAQFLPGIGPARARALERIGVRTAADVVRRVPRAYEDRRVVHPIAEAPDARAAGPAAIEGTVRDVVFRPVRRNFTILEATIEDETGSVVCRWYNRAYLRETIREGLRLVVWGDVERDLTGPVSMSVRDWAEVDRRREVAGHVYPVYPLTKGVTQRALRRAVAAALRAGVLPEADGREPALRDAASALAEAFGLPALPAAARAIHFPRAPEEVEPARRRLALEECLVLARDLVRRRRARPAARSRPPALDVSAVERLRAGLPFALTPGQVAAWDEIRRDLAGPRPMRRLLQADVGAGKTAVAALAAAAVGAAGRQAAVMAPTEVLAEQHHANWAGRLGTLGLRCDLLSAAHRDERAEILGRLASGETAVVFGTHALLEPDVRFRDLALAVVDEEQRFGVAQREALLGRGEGVDLLLLTATPIPRTQALTLYADLDVTTIPDKPPGRGAIETVHLRRRERREILPLVARTLEAGRQVLFVYPLVEESAARDLKAATAQAERIAAAFPAASVGCLTGRLPGEDREGVARDFREGRLRILVATTVVEVGIDVPGADLVVIEHAERFGLAQLHQLRGRVGRGTAPGTCVLTTDDDPAPDARARIEALLGTTDGFEIAEKDLALRGPGELAGLRQHGSTGLRVARLPDDADLLKASLDALDALPV